MSIILMGIYKIFIGKVIKRCFRLKAEPVSLRRLSSHHASSSNSADARGLILLQYSTFYLSAFTQLLIDLLNRLKIFSNTRTADLNCGFAQIFQQWQLNTFTKRTLFPLCSIKVYPVFRWLLQSLVSAFTFCSSTNLGLFLNFFIFFLDKPLITLLLIHPLPTNSI